MDLRERRFEIGDEIAKGPLKRLRPRDDHPVEARLTALRQDCLSGGFQAPPRAIAGDRDSDFAAGGKSDAWRRRQVRILGAACGLQDKARRNPTSAAGSDGQKFGPALEARNGSHRSQEFQSLRPTAACGPWRAGSTARGGRQRSPCARENRGGACEPVCSADRYASLAWLRRRFSGDRRRCIGEQVGEVNAAAIFRES